MEKEKRDKKLLLGELLLAKAMITKEQLAVALEEQKKTGKLLAQIITEKQWASEEQVYRLLSEQLGIAYFSLANIKISTEIINLIPESIVRAYWLMPVKKEGEALLVAMSEPQNTFAIDQIRSLTGLKINPVLSSRKDIQAAIENYYGEELAIHRTLPAVEEGQEPEEESPVEIKEEDEQKLKQVAAGAPIVRLVDAIILDGVRGRGSDIHIEPSREGFRIRFRVDGILHDITSPPRHLYRPVVSRIKIMANMDIAEKRLPQDGSFKVELEDKHVDIRVSTYPTIYGEKVVMRLLIKEESFVKLNKLGFEDDELAIFEHLISKSCGIILVVGPTGCGKTTTLYSVLSKINSREKNTITIEDPIEYKIEGIAQSQINPKAGFTFANSLRAMMRQDPDIIMVGEVRDLDTAQLAVRASLTGHLVLSTLHTNDAPGAVIRLIDMGIEPYLISSSLVAVVAQRLVRRVCLECKEEFQPSFSEVASFQQELAKIKVENPKFYRGKGCDFCKHSGYRGREGVFELLAITGDDMKDAITCGCKTSELKTLAVGRGMRTLKENGLRKALKGITTLEEVLRTTELV